MHFIFGSLLLLIGLLLALAALLGIPKLLQESWLTVAGVITLFIVFLLAVPTCFIWFPNRSWQTLWYSIGAGLTIYAIIELFIKTGISTIKLFFINLIGIASLAFLSYLTVIWGIARLVRPSI